MLAHVTSYDSIWLGKAIEKYKLGQSCAKLRSTYASQPDGVSSYWTFILGSILWQLAFDPQSNVTCNHLTSSIFNLINLRSSINKNIFWVHLPFTKIFEVVFHLQKYFMWSSIFKSIWGRLPLTKIFEVVFHIQNIWGRLLFTKYWRSSSIKKKIEVVFHSKPSGPNIPTYLELNTNWRSYKLFRWGRAGGKELITKLTQSCWAGAGTELGKIIKFLPCRQKFL